MSTSISDRIREQLDTMAFSENERKNILHRMSLLQENPIQILLVGATGVGKSSAINALAEYPKATVGMGVDPETDKITPYAAEGFVFWDTPGLGDSVQDDLEYGKMLVDILNEQDGNGKLLIDFVLLLVDGGSRDLGTASDLIRKVILPDLRTEKKNRLLIVVNKIDKALSSRHWDAVHHCPDAVLQKFLEEKALSVQRRIYEDTKWEFETVCLCAGYKDPESMLQEQSYNTTYLLAKLLSMAPVKKRIPRKARTKPAFEHHASASSDDVVEKVLTAATAPIWIPLGIAGAIGEAIDDNCYITTATCAALGKPDDCYELTQFRAYRDRWLRKQPDGEALIREYYDTAPAVVTAINQTPERETIYRQLNETYLQPCLRYIEAGENEKCKALYIQMVRDMQHRFCCEN